MQDDLTRVANQWETHARADARWAVLSDNEKRGGLWDDASFFGTGKALVTETLGLVRSVGAYPARQERVLDFGCGVGRLSRALADFFPRVDGVDVAPSMIAQADAANPAKDRIGFHVNIAPDLRLFATGTFDLVFSFITLQHIGTPLALSYIREFVRITAPGGAIVFQAPYQTNHPGWKYYVNAALPRMTAAYRRVRHGAATHNDVFTHDAADVADVLTQAGAILKRVEAGRPNDCPGWLSAVYIAQMPSDRSVQTSDSMTALSSDARRSIEK